MKIPILGTGLSGLVGTRIKELLEDRYDFVDMSLATGVDITDPDSVLEIFNQSNAGTVIHMAAKTDVDDCEDDRVLGEEGAAWQVNVIGTQNIADSARKTRKRVIYISTDFVFDGTKDFYNEEDSPNPLNWYGRTKHEGEIYVAQSSIDNCIVRLAYPYRSVFEEKLDFVRKIIGLAKNGKVLLALSDHIFTPTFIDDLGLAFDLIIRKGLYGIYHTVGSQSLTPFEATKTILRIFDLHTRVDSVKREDYFKNRAFRPFKLALKNDKITGLGIKMHGFEEGLNEIKKQI